MKRLSWDRLFDVLVIEVALLFVLAAFSGCAPRTLEPRHVGPWRTPIHAYGFISCANNTPIAWIRLDAATHPVVRVSTTAHEAQHVLDIVNAGGCELGWAAYDDNPLWFEARAYCAGFHALVTQRLAPSVEQLIEQHATGIARAMEADSAATRAALTEHCFVRRY